jgi:hypothetical protein
MKALLIFLAQMRLVLYLLVGHICMFTAPFRQLYRISQRGMRKSFNFPPPAFRLSTIILLQQTLAPNFDGKLNFPAVPPSSFPIPKLLVTFFPTP